MSTKSDVTNFLQLGAKYELILTGLFDEVTSQREDVLNSKSRLKEGLESIDRDVKKIELALKSAQAEVKKQNLINKYLYFFIGMNIVAVIVLWLIRL